MRSSAEGKDRDTVGPPSGHNEDTGNKAGRYCDAGQRRKRSLDSIGIYFETLIMASCGCLQLGSLIPPLHNHSRTFAKSCREEHRRKIGQCRVRDRRGSALSKPPLGAVRELGFRTTRHLTRPNRRQVCHKTSSLAFPKLRARGHFVGGYQAAPLTVHRAPIPQSLLHYNADAHHLVDKKKIMVAVRTEGFAH